MPLSRRDFVKGTVAATASVAINLGRVAYGSDRRRIEVSVRAIDLVRQTTVIDMLGLFTFEWPRLYAWYRNPTEFGESDFRFLESSGISVFHPAVNTTTGNPYSDARRWLAGWARLLRANPCFLELISSGEDLLSVPLGGTLGVLMGFQNSEHFRSRDDVRLFHELGLRVSQLTYNHQNRLGSGCLSDRDSGLSDFGAEIVEAMNEAGMAIDVSHCSDRTSSDAIRLSHRPVLVTHSNCRALNPLERRCKSDDVIREMAANGGVIGLTAVKGFVGRRRSVDLEDYVDHFDHVVRLVGPEHVGIGSDIDTQAVDPESGAPLAGYSIKGLEPRLRIFQLADHLLSRGYLEEDVRSILGGNFRRALSDAFGETRADEQLEQPRAENKAGRRDPFCPAPKRTILRPDYGSIPFDR